MTSDPGPRVAWQATLFDTGIVGEGDGDGDGERLFFSSPRRDHLDDRSWIDRIRRFGLRLALRSVLAGGVIALGLAGTIGGALRLAEGREDTGSSASYLAAGVVLLLAGVATACWSAAYGWRSTKRRRRSVAGRLRGGNDSACVVDGPDGLAVLEAGGSQLLRAGRPLPAVLGATRGWQGRPFAELEVDLMHAAEAVTRVRTYDRVRLGQVLDAAGVRRLG